MEVRAREGNLLPCEIAKKSCCEVEKSGLELGTLNEEMSFIRKN